MFGGGCEGVKLTEFSSDITEDAGPALADRFKRFKAGFGLIECATDVDMDQFVFEDVDQFREFAKVNGRGVSKVQFQIKFTGGVVHHTHAGHLQRRCVKADGLKHDIIAIDEKLGSSFIETAGGGQREIDQVHDRHDKGDAVHFGVGDMKRTAAEACVVLAEAAEQ